MQYYKDSNNNILDFYLLIWKKNQPTVKFKKIKNPKARGK